MVTTVPSSPLAAEPVLQVPLQNLDGTAVTLASLLAAPDAPRGGLVVGFLRHYG